MPASLTRAGFEALADEDRYWRGRWPYLRAAIHYANELGGDRVLEIGPRGRPLFDGADTLDVVGPATYVRDAAVVPWPIRDGAYDVAIALQVLEHLRDRSQIDVFREMRRVARGVVISLPYRWDRPGDPHHMITEETIRRWTAGVAPRASVIVGRPPRIVMAWGAS